MTKQLVTCTEKTCPKAIKHSTSDTLINYAPFFAEGGESYAIRATAAAQKKTTWCQQWMDSKASFGLRLVAFAAVQSVMHAGTFASFYKMGERNLLSGLKHVSYFPSSLIIPALHCVFGLSPRPRQTAP